MKESENNWDDLKGYDISKYKKAIRREGKGGMFITINKFGDIYLSSAFQISNLNLLSIKKYAGLKYSEKNNSLIILFSNKKNNFCFRKIKKSKTCMLINFKRHFDFFGLKLEEIIGRYESTKDKLGDKVVYVIDLNKKTNLMVRGTK